MIAASACTCIQTKEPGAPLHPVIRLAGAVLFCLATAGLTEQAAALAALLLALVLFLFSQARLIPSLQRLLVVNAFIAFLWLTVPWSVPGETLAALGPFAVTKEGLELAVLVTVKGNAMLLVFLALVCGMPLPALGAALNALHCPARLTALLLLCYRYLFVLREEWRSLRTSAMLRGFVPKTNLATYKTYAILLGMLLVRSYDRSQRIHEAMRLRGFSGKFPVSALPKYSVRDVVFLSFLLLFLGIPALINYCPGCTGLEFAELAARLSCAECLFAKGAAVVKGLCLLP